MPSTAVSSDTSSFAALYSQHALDALLAHDAHAPKGADGRVLSSGPECDAWTAAYREHKELCSRAIGAYVVSKRDRGELSPIKFTEGRGHRLANAWNRIVACKETPYDTPALSDQIAYSVLMGARLAARPASGEPPRSNADRYQTLVDAMDTGAFEFWTMRTDSECERTGRRLQLDVLGWVARLGEAVPDGAGEFDELGEEAPAPSADHAIINTPSGELLLADWFRIPEFTAAVKTERCFNVNTGPGKMAQTAFYASEKGFASVFVGNTCPSILRRGGHIAIAGQKAYAKTDPQEVGTVCTDLWWATAIDRAVLVALVATQLPPDTCKVDAEKLVSGYLANNDVTRVTVPKGQLHLYYSDAPNDLSDFRCSAVPAAGLEPLYTVLSEQELNWSPKSKSDAVRRKGRKP